MHSLLACVAVGRAEALPLHSLGTQRAPGGGGGGGGRSYAWSRKPKTQLILRVESGLAIVPLKHTIMDTAVSKAANGDMCWYMRIQKSSPARGSIDTTSVYIIATRLRTGLTWLCSSSPEPPPVQVQDGSQEELTSVMEINSKYPQLAACVPCPAVGRNKRSATTWSVGE